jgi:hypothetical protein
MHRSMARRDSSWKCSVSWIRGPPGRGGAGRGGAGRGGAGRGGAGRGGAVVSMPRTGAVAALGRSQTAEGTVVITVMRMLLFETI